MHSMCVALAYQIVTLLLGLQQINWFIYPKTGVFKNYSLYRLIIDIKG